MDLQKHTLAQNMAFLLSIPPDSNLAKLLKFCLVTNIQNESSHRKPLDIALALIEKPSNLNYWTPQVMALDRQFTEEEWKALGEMDIKNAEEFINNLWQELEKINL